MVLLATLTLLSPLFAAVAMTVSPRLRKSRLGPLVAIGSVFLSLVSGIVFLADGTEAEGRWAWMDFGSAARVEMGVLVDPLSILMLLVVGGVGSAIFVYALGYMKGDPSIGRFFAKFALFVFSMLGIVFANNFLMIFVFWELVGASSYLLIGYYWDKPSANAASVKAFLTNRVADFGFLLGILLVWSLAGSFHFGDIERAVAEGTVDASAGWKLPLAALLIFLGAAGKSAQIPFHVWLPDAMEGPTPVSALMHAATMVAAGVYMLVRTFFLFGGVGELDWGWAPGFVANTGGLTALLAATIALVQRDIKRVLAYSTLSQLGYMVMAVGVGAFGFAMLHLTMHAFFKGLLFLCAGSVIHGCHHEQDMFAMGGLRKRMPVTFATFTVGMLALTGIFPLAGFWSKDLILDAQHLQGETFLYVVGTVTAGLTALYMGRAWLLTFHGEYRGHADPHESPRVMTWPLVYLAVLSAVLGAVAFPALAWLARWSGTMAEPHIDPVIAAASTGAAVAGYLIAWRMYGRGWERATKLKERLPRLHALLENRYYIDDFYLWLVRGVQQRFASICRAFEEKVVVDGAVGGVAGGTKLLGERLRRVQTGRLAFYAYVLVGGVTLFVFALVLILPAVQR